MNRRRLAVLTLFLTACGQDGPPALDSRAQRIGPPLTSRGSGAEGLLVPGWNPLRCFDASLPAAGRWDPDGDTMDNRCVRFSQQNIWSRAVPQEPCVGASLWGSTRVAAEATECFWPRQTFYGWQGLNQVGSTAYSDILAQYAGW